MDENARAGGRELLCQNVAITTFDTYTSAGHPTDNEEVGNEGLLKFLRFAAAQTNTKAPSTYTRALDSFIAFLQGRNATLLPDPKAAVTDWTVHLCLSRMSLKTAIPYLKAVGSLYNKAVKEGLAPSTDVFKTIMAELRQGEDTIWATGITDVDFDRLKALVKANKGTSRNVATELLLFSLTNGCVPVEVAATLKRDDIPAYDFSHIDIDPTQFKGNRKYLFALDQSTLTPKQLTEKTGAVVTDLLERHDISHTASANITIRSYWAHAALLAGVSATTVRSFLNTVPAFLPILKICGTQKLTDAQRAETSARVARMFTPNPLRWYVMRLRPGKRFEHLTRKFDSLRGSLDRPELFYPCDEIFQHSGNKLSPVKKPVIPEIVFFKSRETEIYPMFQKIGDIAWCYRVNGASGSAYAAIPQKAFELFQKTIGHFSADYELAPIGGLRPAIGDRIVVLGGPFQNHEGIIDQIKADPLNDRTIYRLNLLGENGAKWDVGIDARIISKNNKN